MTNSRCPPILDARRRRDPTGTTSVRRAFEAEAARRFRRLKALVSQAVIQNDVFGLKQMQPVGTVAMTRPESPPAIIPLVRDAAPTPGAFAFNRSGDKVAMFMEWLNEQQDEGILEVTPGASVGASAEAAWADVYIEAAYQKGLRDAGAKLRAAGATVAPSWIETAFSRPIHADRVGLAYTRVFTELKGITQAMDQQISRELARGLSEGQNPMAIARRINDRIDRIGITRARTLARTEVIAAHADASLNAYEEAGAYGVEVEAELSTAEDDRVCEECAALDGRTFTLEEARGLIPVHPNCRCAMIPRVVNGSGIQLY